MNNGKQTQFGPKDDVMKPKTQNVVGGQRPAAVAVPAAQTQKGAAQ